MAESYDMLRATSEGFYKEKGSKFIAHAYPVTRVDQVKPTIEKLKKQYHDARHFCFAYIIRDGQHEQVRANDDGEPNHSAGDPILGQIKSKQLTNTLVVVVRYFGGTKLGVSGLIQAYKTAAEEALNVAKIITIEIKSEFEIEYGYEVTSDTLRILNDFKVEIIAQEYLASCILRGKLEPEVSEALTAKLALIKVKLKLL
jgi:uncharacterized YigZ family protein